MPNTPTPTPRPDVEGIASRSRDVVKNGLVSPIRLELLIDQDIPALTAYIKALEKELRCPLGFEDGSEDCSAGTCPPCLSFRLKAATDKVATLMKVDYRISHTDCTAAFDGADMEQGDA